MEYKKTHDWLYPKLYLTWLVSLCVITSHRVQGQDAFSEYADSLLNDAREAPTTALKIERLLQVSVFWVDYDTTKAYHYLGEARQLMKPSPSDYENGLYHLYRANILMDFETEKAKAVFLIADSLFAREATAKSYQYRSKLWNNYGVVLQKEDKSAEFMEVIVRKTIPYARLAGDSVQVGYQLQNMAMLMSNLSNYEEAANYYDQALLALRTVPKKQENRLDIFINAARNALFMRDQAKARSYLDSAKTYVQHLPHAFISAPNYYRTELTYYSHIGHQQKVIENYEKGISAAKHLDNPYMLKDLSFEMSMFYRDKGDYQKARDYLILSNSYQPYTRLQNRALYQREIAALEYQLGNYKRAYGYMDSLRITKDSIYQRDVASKLLHFEQQYQAAEKENHILRLETKNRKQELSIARSQFWGLVLGVGLLLAVCTAYFWRKTGQDSKRLLEQKDLLHAEELRSIRQQERLNQYAAMLQGQEAERSRMAKDLHDGLGGLLAGVKLKLSSILARLDGRNESDISAIKDVVHQLDYSVDELRRISHDIMPEALRIGGLVAALSDLCRYMSNTNMQVVFQNLGISDNYPDPVRITVYRIVQELLANAIKHANAKKVIVQCSELDDWLFVTVEDNGKGMEYDRDRQEKGLGLGNIRNRISLLNGNIEILSQPGEGTTVNIQILL